VSRQRSTNGFGVGAYSKISLPFEASPWSWKLKV
jgi:hypothetical protein